MHVHSKDTKTENTHSFRNENQERIAHRCQEPELKLEKTKEQTEF